MSNHRRHEALKPPLWLLAELTWACPLQCTYCSNPLDYASRRDELSTEQWIKVLTDARNLGAVQLGLSGGEPATRQDLEELVAEARRLGYYSNLITSGLGLDAKRVNALRGAGLDHIQLSFQAADAELNDAIAGTRCFEHKLALARNIKDSGYPMVLCFVLHRGNLHQVADMLTLAEDLGADYVELATAQYYGWALRNRDLLLPSPDQLAPAETAVAEFRERHRGSMQVYYVVPDYYEGRPKACMNGWGSMYLVITPDGIAQPCHAAASIPDLALPNVREHELDWIWRDSPAFNRFRGQDWMKPPCRECPEREKDFGGCRCQAMLLTGDASDPDPACALSPDHARIETAIESSQQVDQFTTRRLVYRNPRN